MKSWLIALSMTVGATSLGVFSVDAEARRLGGARPSGMQRQLPPRQPDATPQSPAQQTAPAQNANAPAAQAAPGGTAAAAGATAQRRSWMGPIAGLAAGLGLAALFSHLGLSAALANFVMAMLLVLAVVLVLRFVLRRFAANAAGNRQPQYAGAGAGPGARGAGPSFPIPAPAIERSGPAAAASSAAPSALPAGMDAQDFERVAKMLFIRLQASNDAGEIEDLRRFTTPELFASLRVDLQDRAGRPQRTDVVQLDAQLVDTAQQDGHAIASVRFSGLIREEAGEAPAQPFAELWHLVRPLDGSSEWRIAGISPEQG